jgi:hypothetical protein
MSVKVIYPTEAALIRATKANKPKGFLARWFAEVLEKGQSLRYLESVGGL